MRNLLAAALIVGNLASLCTATGRHGAAERVFQFAAYELETLIGEPFSIAPDCGIHQDPPVRRCTFGQFLNYIWAPNTNAGQTQSSRPWRDATIAYPGGKRPDGTPIDKVQYDVLYDNVDEKGINTIVSVLGRPQKLDDEPKGPTTQVNDWVDAERLYPGAGDYATANDRISERAAIIWRRFDSDASLFFRDRAAALYTRAAKALTASLEIRLSIRDHHKTAPLVRAPNDPLSGRNRIVWLERNFQGLLVMKPAANTQGFIGRDENTVLDAAATRARMNDNQRRAFDADIRAWVDNPFNNRIAKQHEVQIQRITKAVAKLTCGGGAGLFARSGWGVN